MESKKYIQKDPDQIQILVKEGKDKKVYTESEKKKESQEEKTEDNSINTEITKNKENEENINTQIAKKFPGDKKFLVLGGYPDIVAALLKRGWTQSKNPEDKTIDFLYTLKNADIPFIELKSNILGQTVRMRP